jgi:hypothetical protein
LVIHSIITLLSKTYKKPHLVKKKVPETSPPVFYTHGLFWHHFKRSHLSFLEAKKSLLQECVIKWFHAENPNSIGNGTLSFSKTMSCWTLSACSPRKECMQLNLEDTFLIFLKKFYLYFFSL